MELLCFRVLCYLERLLYFSVVSCEEYRSFVSEGFQKTGVSDEGRNVGFLRRRHVQMWECFAAIVAQNVVESARFFLFFGSVEGEHMFVLVWGIPTRIPSLFLLLIQANFAKFLLLGIFFARFY